jgi:hypothetical protein
VGVKIRRKKEVAVVKIVEKTSGVAASLETETGGDLQ